MGNLLCCLESSADDQREQTTLSTQRRTHSPEGWRLGNTVEATDDSRAEASLCAQRRNELFARSREAWRLGNKVEAKSLSNAAKVQAKLMVEANEKAAETLFNKNNAQRDVGVLDLHGLFVKEAIEKVEERIALCKKLGQKELVVIVGKGNHSKNGKAILKPMVEKYMHEYGLSVTVGKPNDGCLYVEFNNKGLFLQLVDTCAVM
ncbi:hypothetical protein L7F22_020070 [Adiantum nelumboides]|nr:hypothetical protein [Adiantum nelumboides]